MLTTWETPTRMVLQNGHRKAVISRSQGLVKAVRYQWREGEWRYHSGGGFDEWLEAEIYCEDWLTKALNIIPVPSSYV